VHPLLCHLSAWFRKRKGRTEHGVKIKTKETMASRKKKILEMELESMFETQ
jgi:hypothetical protein